MPTPRVCAPVANDRGRQAAPFTSAFANRATRVRPRSYQRRSAKLAKKKKSVRRQWTKDDLKTLKLLAKQKTGVTTIAKKLKRTPGATAAKAFVLRVSLSTQ